MVSFRRQPRRRRAIALCKQALSTALRELLAKLRSVTVRGMLKLALKRGAQFAAFTALSKGGLRDPDHGGHDPAGIEVILGRDADSFTTGFISGPLSFGMHGPMAESLAMAGGQVGDNVFRKLRSEALGDQQWAKLGLYQTLPRSGYSTASLMQPCSAA